MTMHKLVTIFFFTLTIASVHGQKQQDLSSLLNKIKAINEVQYEHVGFGGTPSDNFKNYLDLKSKTTTTQTMKIKLIIALILTLFSCQTDKQNEEKDLVKYYMEKNKSLVYEVELIDGLSYPSWLKGVWQNTTESNTNNFITYSFKNNKLTIRQGLRFQGAEKFIELYKDYKILETASDSTYFFELTNNNRSIVYEFKLQSVEWSDEKVLTYSIIENGKLKREHLKSIQLVLSKI